MSIGAGERQDGLYYYRDVPALKAFKVEETSSLDLWHARMGHPSFKIIKSLPVVSIQKDSVISNKGCEVCHRAK